MSVEVLGVEDVDRVDASLGCGRGVCAIQLRELNMARRTGVNGSRWISPALWISVFELPQWSHRKDMMMTSRK